MKLSVKHFNRQVYEASVLDEDLLNGGEIFLGREEDCHIQLESQMISRHHAIISKIKENIILKVLSHYGGVKVNGNEVFEIALNNEDKITIEDYEIILKDVPVIEKVLEDITPIAEEVTQLVETPLVEDTPIEETPVAEEAIDEEESIDDVVDNLDDEVENILPDEGEAFDLDTDQSEAEEIDEPADDLNQLHLDDLEGENNSGLDYQESSQDEYNSDDNFSNNDEGYNDDFQNNDENGFASDDNFGEDNFGDDGFGSDDGFGGDDGFEGGGDSEATQVFQNFAQFTLSIFGEFAPFDRFRIEEANLFIGRDPEK